MPAQKKSISSGSLTAVFKNHTSALFWLMLIVLFASEVYVIQASVRTLLAPAASPPIPTAGTDAGRVNFSAYNQAITKITAGQSYVPPDETLPNPFTPVPKPTSGQ